MHTYKPGVLTIRFSVDSLQDCLIRALGLLGFITPIVLVHRHCVRPLPPGATLWYAIELFYVVIHEYGLNWMARTEPWIAVGCQTWALWVMMFLNLILGVETSLLRALLLPPIASFTSMSSLLLLVHGTLGTWLLPFTDWDVIRCEDDTWSRLQRQIDAKLDEPGVVEVKYGFESLQEGLLKALALLSFITPIVMIHRYYVQPLPPGAVLWYLIEFFFVAMHGYGLDWETTKKPWIAVGYQTWALWVMMFINVIIGTETSYLRAVLLPPVVSFTSMSSLLFFVYGTHEIWLLEFTDWEVIYRDDAWSRLQDRIEAKLDEPGVVGVKYGVDSLQEVLMRALALLGSITPIIMIHVHYVQPLPPRRRPMVLD
ncbi:hypothetical protein PM082_000800 [Marasmius tenuissimus]|nr:hypothetical protein PM082_000800 [Marasmius tenuissimus]